MMYLIATVFFLALTLLMIWRGGQHFLPIDSPFSRAGKNAIVSAMVGLVAYFSGQTSVFAGDYAVYFAAAAAIGLGGATGFIGYATGHFKSLECSTFWECCKCAASGVIIILPVGALCWYHTGWLIAWAAFVLCAPKPAWYTAQDRGPEVQEPWQWTQIGEYGTAVTTALAVTICLFVGAV